ncbi:MAG: hypothetical protein ACTHJW_21125 [Streptosporangiaceae bacterium]
MTLHDRSGPSLWQVASRRVAGGPASAFSAAAAGGGCVFIFTEQDQARLTRWATAIRLPAARPQGTVQVVAERRSRACAGPSATI